MKNINDKKISFKNKNIIFILFLLTSTFIFSCEKEPVDYREKWVGMYEYNKKYQDRPVGSGWLNVVAKGDSMIYITVCGDLEATVDGSFGRKEFSIKGYFKEDSIYILCWDGPLGMGGFTREFRGKKLKN
ncbi:MAG: hypothetical protein LBU51_10480 [Bacteroidales bacterium]|jgi:hypothetical protein|nr:hypothetical protein [Bacteroidales bacterium]